MTKKIIIVSLTILALFTTGAVVYLRKQFPQKPSANNAQTITATTTQTLQPPMTTSTYYGMKLYRNEEFGFEFWYPEGWWVEENRNINPFIKLEVNVRASPQGMYRHFKPFVALISTVEHAKRVLASHKSEGTPVQAIIDGKNITGYSYFGPADYTTYIIIFDDHGVFIYNENKENVPEFNKILSTFKFIK